MLGLRGDGLYAGFGPWEERGVSVALAGLAAAACLDGVMNEVNPWLDGMGMRHVQARAGADFGDVTFTRTGTPGSSEVNVVGFSANFAAKSEKTANAWEVVVGAGFAAEMDDRTLLTSHERSPKRYQRDFEIKSYAFYDYSWRAVLSEVQSTMDEFRGRPLASL